MMTTTISSRTDLHEGVVDVTSSSALDVVEIKIDDDYDVVVEVIVRPCRNSTLRR